MSYEKAMKHSRNIRKQKKQSRMYKGFDTGYGSPFSSKESREILVQMMEVNRWYKARHIGNAQYNRECIVESVQTLRAMRKFKVSGN